MTMNLFRAQSDEGSKALSNLGPPMTAYGYRGR